MYDVSLQMASRFFYPIKKANSLEALIIVVISNNIVHHIS
jgi:hypothetical protein